MGGVATLARFMAGASAAALLTLGAGVTAASAADAPEASAAPVLKPGQSLRPASPAADVSGKWWIRNYKGSIVPLDGKPVPLKPEARKAFHEYVDARDNGKIPDDTATFCLPDGVVRASGTPYPFEIRQVGDQVFVMYEEDRTTRFVNLGGKRTPLDDMPFFTFMGESIGHWEGDTLVIEATGFNKRTVLDQTGIPHGEQMKTTERLRLIEGGKVLESIITIEDPEFFTRPWQVRYTYVSRPDVQLQEYVCGEPHRDVTNVVLGRQKFTAPTNLPPVQAAPSAIDYKSPNPGMARVWGRGPWRHKDQKPGELGRNDGNGAIPAITEGWDDRDKMLKHKYLGLMKTYDAGLSAGFPPPTSSSACDFDGFPSIIGLPNQWQMIHTPDTVYIVYGYNTHVRRIYMNQTHPRDVKPSWLGYSTGRWEGDQLVILTTGITDKSTLNWDGIPHSDQLRVTERYTLLPDGRLKVDMLLEDPVVLTGPWTVTKHFAKAVGMDETNCSEDNGVGGAPTE